ncbi:MAG: fimbrial assembly protein [Sideroxydans sp.]|nr:fimbrial assembly protein [Sideroxydans sp.]
MSQQINLFNPIFMQQRKYFSLSAMVQSLALIVVGALLFFVFAWYQVRQLDAQNIASQLRLNSDQMQVAKLETEFSPELSNRQRQEEIQQLQAQLEESTQLVNTLKSGVIGNTVGYSQYMSAFSRQVLPGLWLTGFDVRGGDAAQIGITGAVVDAKLLPSYIQRLSAEKSMQGKSFTHLKMQQVKSIPSKDSLMPPVPRFIEFTLQSSIDSEAKK